MGKLDLNYNPYGSINTGLTGGNMVIDPITLSLVGAGVGGIGSFFGGQAEADAAAKNLAFEKQKYQDTLASKLKALGLIRDNFDTSGYGKTLDYVNPYQGALDTSIGAFLSGKLTDAETTQQARDIASGTQALNAAAATMGMTAGARAGLTSKLASDISQKYATIASDRIGTGISAANQAAATGANIASMNYDTGIQNFLNQQQARNQKATLMAGYA